MKSSVLYLESDYVTRDPVESISVPVEAPCFLHCPTHMSQDLSEIICNKGHFTYICQLP